MNPSLSFRLMQGKGTCTGHIRKSGTVHVTCRGLSPEKPYALYCSEKQAALQKADAQGGLSISFSRDGFFFLCDEKQKVILWEGGEEGYCRALALLPKEQPPPPERPVKKTAPITEAAAPPPPVPQIPFRCAPPHADAPPAASLPVLSWPSGMQRLTEEMEKGAPFSPFALPGFRCRKCVSSSPAVPFWVLGYQTKGSRVTALFYAVPGTPMHPPVPLPGYRYQSGYWYHIQRMG